MKVGSCSETFDGLDRAEFLHSTHFLNAGTGQFVVQNHVAGAALSFTAAYFYAEITVSSEHVGEGISFGIEHYDFCNAVDGNTLPF